MRQYYDKLDEMSVSDIFDATPDNESVLREDCGCSIRLPSKFTAKYPYPDAEECYRMFQIRKYIQKDFMCYEFDPIIIETDEDLLISEYAVSPQAAGLIYKIYLNNSLFGDASYYETLVKQRFDSPLFDAAFSSSKVYMRQTNLSNNYLNIELIYNSVAIHMLRNPYDTRCLSCAPYHTCAELNAARIGDAVLKKFEKVSTLVPVYDKSLKYPVLSAKHLRNDEFVAKYKRIHDKVFSGSSQTCDTYYTSSRVTITYGSVTMVSVYYPHDANISVNYFPLQDPIDFLLYISSSFGIWIGVSVLSFCGAINDLLIKFKGKVTKKEINH